MITEWITVPTTMFPTRDSAATIATLNITLTEAIFAVTLIIHTIETTASIPRCATIVTFKPVRIPARITIDTRNIVGSGATPGIRLAVRKRALHQTTTMRATGKQPIIALNAPINTIRAFAQLVALTPIVETQQPITFITGGIKVIPTPDTH
jgi:hypothetical protein